MQINMRNLKAAALVATCAIFLSGCGGGGDVASGASSASPVVYSGPIGGFGSVVLNGVRFSTVGSTMVDDDGASVDLSKLHLGMTVRVTGNADDATHRGAATKVEMIRGTRGVISAVSVDAGSTTSGVITVLGQTIFVDSTTAYQGVSGLSSLASMNSPSVEVYGSLRADGSMLATLIEVKTLTAFSVTGKVSNINIASSTFQVGTLTVTYDPASLLGTLVDGVRVKVKAATGALVGNSLAASSVKVLSVGWTWGSNTTGVFIKAKGVVDAAPVDGILTLSGTQVDISKAIIEGSGSIIAGQSLEIKGTWDDVRNMLVATKVEFEGARDVRHELYGVVSSLSGNIAVVNGVTVDLSAANFTRGTRELLAVGSYVEIKGYVTGNTLTATKVEFKSGRDADGTAYEQFGLVTDFFSISDFKLNGITVDATNAIVEYGSAADVADGVYLEIKGTQNAGGVLVATKIEIKRR